MTTSILDILNNLYDNDLNTENLNIAFNQNENKALTPYQLYRNYDWDNHPSYSSANRNRKTKEVDF